MPITATDVRCVADLARLKLTESEVAEFGSQLNVILDYAAQLGGVDIARIAEAAQTGDLVDAVGDGAEHLSGRDDTFYSGAAIQGQDAHTPGGDRGTGDLLETIAAGAAALRRGEVSAVELTEAALGRIEATDDEVGAYLARTFERARSAAAAADRRFRDDPGGVGPLCGVPVAIKDLLCVEGTETTGGSRILQGFVPPYSATAVQRLIYAGAVIVGKTNCDEFGMGSSNENSAFGQVHNPWDVTRVPGGSSGGSAAAVAAGSVPYSLGTDTGGSIRQPAALCGIVGFKPSFGRVSRHGLVPGPSSLDQIGPLAHTVEDAALVYAAIAGRDPWDETTSCMRVDDPFMALRAGARGLRLGVPAEYFGDGLAPGVQTAVEDALKTFEELGATLIGVALPTTPAALATYFIVASAEYAWSLACIDAGRFGTHTWSSPDTESSAHTRAAGFGAVVKGRIMMGTYVASAGRCDGLYRRAQDVRTVFANEFAAVFDQVDVLVGPTSPITAFPLGSREDPLALYLSDALTIPVNLAGLPGASLPCGFAEGLPVGLQIIGPRFADARVLRVAQAFERATDWHTRRSPIATSAV